MSERFQDMRLIEAVLFASADPLRTQDIARFLPEGSEVDSLLEELAGLYANRGVNLVRVGDRWAFRSAADLAPMMKIEKPVKRKLSRASIETLAIIAYHQPVTRGEVEEIRGVGLSRGTLDNLLEAEWIKPRGRRRTPGRPVTWGTTDAFLDHFGLESLESLPGLAELKAAGLLDSRPAITALTALGQGAGLDEEAQDEAESTEDEFDEAASAAAVEEELNGPEPAVEEEPDDPEALAQAPVPLGEFGTEDEAGPETADPAGDLGPDAEPMRAALSASGADGEG